MMRSIAPAVAGVLLWALAVPAMAHRQHDTDYECEQLAARDLGVRCRVSLRGDPFFLLWVDDKTLTDKEQREQGYQTREIADAFVRRGGKYAIVRRFADGQHQKKLCNYIEQQYRMGCGNWMPAEDPGTEWTAIVPAALGGAAP